MVGGEGQMHRDGWRRRRLRRRDRTPTEQQHRDDEDPPANADGHIVVARAGHVHDGRQARGRTWNHGNGDGVRRV